ncbi:methyl-accepting chemotaxis protein [Sphingomonas hengshuiensis]|uniref:Chemotaxis protein n=1 Tax=Sphingomonas hengshuiensis TaxID=1609977 RepID=A0A7U5BFT4_9SPHN|nr:methyl-accepting chemotaxis protein [Sphingomonas hengshuiensis]AJP74469.1 chemotaxis protein [Sphingomonas hengshuiensis]
MSIGSFVRNSALAMMAILLVGGLFAISRLDNIRMGGKVQVAQQMNADLIADILPPPEYVIEPYLEATLLARDPDTVAQRAARLAELRKLYDERHAFWITANVDADLKAQLLEHSHPAAMRFWTIAQGAFLDAVCRQDRPAIDAAYGQLSAAYADHRREVDKLVSLTLDRQKAVAAEGAREFMVAIGIVLALGVVVGAQALHFYITMYRRVLEPIGTLSGLTARLASGGDADIPYRERTDEIGSIAVGLEHYRASAAARIEADARNLAEQRRMTDLLGGGLLALREGDLSHTIDQPFPAEYEVLRQNINEAIAALRDKVQLLRDSAGNIGVTSRELAQGSEDLARRTEGGAHNVAKATMALVQIEERLKDSMQAADTTVKRADGAIAMVEDSRSTTGRAVQAMERARGSALNIDGVIEGLDKIAFQTRVLAMNAAVEAGRAGESGRGFAVVADLVSALAMRAEDQAKQAREMLTETQADILQAADAVAQTQSALDAVTGDFEAVHALISAIDRDNHAQSTAVSEVAHAMKGLDTITQQNAAMVEQTSAALGNLSGEVGALATRAGAFRFERDGGAPLAVPAAPRPTVH